MFLGNPLSSMGAPVDMLPWHGGQFGQLLVPGAAGSLLRIASYFSDASAVKPWLVLLCWAGVGLALTGLAHARRPSSSPAKRPTTDNDVVAPRRALEPAAVS